VLDNTALGNGGGLYINGGAATLANTTFSGNKANANGGGIRSGGASLTLNNVTLTNNTADNDAGGTTGNGGGLYRSSGTIHVKNSLIAGNFDRSATPSAQHADCSGAFASQGYNLIGKNRGCSGFANGVNGDRVGTDASPINPQLAALANNGGPTLTLALLTGSPAIDAGNPASPGSGGNACEATDQRGVARPIGAACDIGAFEAEAAPPRPLTIRVTIDQSGSLGRGGRSATIHGTVTCSQPVPITIAGTLTQKSGKKTITGSFEIAVECKGRKGQAAWSATVRPNKGHFEEGKVTATVTASAVDPGSGQTVQATASRKVQLKR
jgi:predicted outer membrane repeat protein